MSEDSDRNLANRLTENERRILRSLDAGTGLREVEIDRLVTLELADRDIVSGAPAITPLGRDVLRLITETPRHERRNRWNFAFSDELWNWSVARPDGSVVVSGESFRTPQQCAEDAVRNGYVAWPTSQERRKTRPSNPLSVFTGSRPPPG